MATTMTTDERIDALQEAQDLLREAVLLVRQATSDTTIEERARRLVIAYLEMATDSNHDWLGRSTSIEDLIEDLKEEEDEELEDEAPALLAEEAMA